MRKVLFAASAAALVSLTGVGAAQAGSGIWVNGAANVAEIHGNVDISAGRGAEIGHVGWHEDNWKNINRDGLGTISTVAAGALNSGNIVVGEQSVTRATFGGGIEVSGAYFSNVHYDHVDGSRDQFLGTDVEYHRDHLGAIDAGWFGANGGFGGNITSVDGIPSGIAINAAVNVGAIDASVTVAAHAGTTYFGFDGGSIGNLGNISTTAIGAQNSGSVVVGVPGNIGGLGLGE